jgi:subtilase-type serine protease
MRHWIMQTALLSVVVGTACATIANAAPPTGVSYVTLDYKGPGAVNTFLTGIREEYIVGLYTTSSNASHGLIYNRLTQTWKQLDVYVGGVAAPSTSPYGPDPVTGGLHVVGSYKLAGSSLDHGFYYDSTQALASAFVYLDYPSTSQGATLNTIPHSIYGNQIVGNYDTSLKTGNAFLYNIGTKTYRNINKPNDSPFNPTLSTTAYGIWENHVAGSYTNLTGTHAYLHDLSTGIFTIYDYPKAILTHFDGLTGNGVEAFNYTGDYLAGGMLTAFFFDGTSYSSLKYPGSVIASGNSVYDRTVIGVYVDTTGLVHGYVASVPPSQSIPGTTQWLLDSIINAYNKFVSTLPNTIFG